MVSMEGRLLDMPYVILFEIFRRLPKNKLIKTSKLCSKFKNVAGDARLWKDVFIEFKRDLFSIAFDDLYSEPWPVKAIDMSNIRVTPPVSSKTDQVVKVTKLKLSKIEADQKTMEAILAQYQCTELYMDWAAVDVLGHIMRITPEAFSKQPALEMLSLRQVKFCEVNRARGSVTFQLDPHFHLWLAPVLRNCKKLKTLDLGFLELTDFDIMDFVKSLPTSLEKLCLVSYDCPENYFFELLAKRIPNLKELGLHPTNVKCPALLNFQFLEALHIKFRPHHRYDISDVCMYLLRFPALKTVYSDDPLLFPFTEQINLEKLQTMLKSHGIIVRPTEEPKWRHTAVGGNLWLVSKEDV